jgi:hypothetical protein
MWRLAGLLAVVVVVGCAGAPTKPAVTGGSTRHPYLKLAFVRQFKLQRGATEAVVPDGLVWALGGNNVAGGQVTTSDVLIDGRAAIGDFELEGRYWLTFQRTQSQTVWIYEKTKVGLGDTRPMLTVAEFRELAGR